jgi:hypothetical protein
MTLMYDSVTPADISRDAEIVAGYIDGEWAWSDADWALFPKAEKVRITISASLDDGRVLDVENGDATPEQAPGWSVMRRKATVNPLGGRDCIYTSLDNWPAVKAAYAAAKVAEPDYWIAEYQTPPDSTIPEGAVAKQYASAGVNIPGSPNIDISNTVAGWPVAAPTPKPPAPAPIPEPKGTPTAAQLKTEDLVVMANVADADEAVNNGWTLYYYSEGHKPYEFNPQVDGKPTGCALYANTKWKTKKS